MSRDQRAANNWALIAATREANVSNRLLLVILTLVPDGANSRQVQFMLSGLKETEAISATNKYQWYCLRLNDTYALDGHETNGYVGCLCAIGGLHDRAWQRRPVFGMVRYMNYEACKRKFNIKAYINRINQLL